MDIIMVQFEEPTSKSTYNLKVICEQVKLYIHIFEQDGMVN